MVDPPLGWTCGFPKELPEGVTDVTQWLLDNGYPASIVKTMGDDFTYRIFEITKNQKNGKKNNQSRTI